MFTSAWARRLEISRAARLTDTTARLTSTSRRSFFIPSNANTAQDDIALIDNRRRHTIDTGIEFALGDEIAVFF